MNIIASPVLNHTNGASPHPVAPPSIEVIDISKRFGPLQALTNVSLKLPPGQFRALLGENGAGKSTLVKCVMGTYHADTGRVLVGAHDVEVKTPRQAHALGIGMVYQHFTLVENMTVLENMVVAREHIPAIINWKAEEQNLSDFMDHMPFRVKPTALVRHLSAGEKQKVELLKQLYLRRKVLILDEPTSVLTPQEADEMLSMVRGMCNEGRVSVLMISHKFREVMAFCDEISVLRHGKLTGEGKVSELTTADMAKMMMGSAEIPKPAQRTTIGERPVEKPRLILEEVVAHDEMGVAVLQGLSLAVSSHEIVGIAGVSGNGQRHLVQVLAGQRDASSGRVQVRGEDFRGRRNEIHRHNFRILPEMPLQNACVSIMTTAENLAFRHFDQPPLTRARCFLSPSAMKVRAEHLIQRFNIRPPWPWARIGNLSGGNVQRAVLARELDTAVEVLVVANPCFGLDFKSTAEIRSQIVEARNRGTAVLLISEDLDEILELADRVMVISGGKIVHETPVEAADRQVIGRYMAGH